MELNISRLRKLLFMFVMVFSFTLAHAQEKVVTGFVTDANDSMGIPGVSVVVKGTTIGTTTDIDGKYTLSVDPASTIIYSFVGYRPQEILVGTQSQINVILNIETENLSEIVVIGYGQVKKEDATGSVTAIDEDSFSKGAASSPQDLIVGKIAGVSVVTGGGQPGSNSTIRIRGGSSLNASNDPLFVIDGIPVDNDKTNGLGNPLSTINQDDIKTFTVLKDASATAIYGSRASNGVILITTKSGKAGEGMKIDFNSKLSVAQVKDYVDVLNASQFRNLVTELDKDPKNMMGTADTDWQKEIFETAIGQEHTIGISGSLKGIPYRVSGSYSNQDGVLMTSNMEKATGALRITPKFFDNHLSINSGIKFAKIDSRFADEGAIGSALRFDPTQPVRQGTENGGYFAWYSTDDSNNSSLNTLAPNNPVAMLKLKHDESTVYRYTTDFQADYKLHFLPELKVSMKLGYDYTDSEGTVKLSHDAAWASYERNQTYRKYQQEKKNKLLNVFATYNKDLDAINSKLEVMAGYEWQHFWRSESSEARNEILDIDLTELPSKTENYLLSYFGRLNYSFLDRYMLTFTLRQDGSSRFGDGNKKGLFPAAAFAWKVTDEAFMQEFEKLSSLKLRLGYGITGQQNIGQDYPYLPVFQQGDQFAQQGFGNTYYHPIRPNAYDGDIKWEETTTYNLGIDFGFYNNRITGSLDLYKRKTTDLLNEINIAAGSNFSNRLLTNVGDLENKGVELSLNALAISNSDFSWEIGFNIAHNENEITKLNKFDDPNFTGIDVGGIAGGTGNTIQKNAVGHSIRTFYVKKQVYDNAGNPIEGLYEDINGDGVSNDDDKYYYKTPDADVLIGFSNSFTYKNFDFAFSGRVSLGNYVYDSVNSDKARYNNISPNDYLGNLTTDILNTKFTEPQFHSDYYMHNASFLKIDNISLGYQFKDLIQKHFNKTLNLRMYCSLQNAIVITKYDGLDPEISYNRDLENIVGIDNLMYPRPRTILFGISAKF